MTGTVEQCVDDGDTSAEALTDALSDLLISYELAPDEDAASAICVSLSEQLSGSMPVSSQAEERPKLLSAPVLMGEDRADDAPISLTSRPVNMDALGNSCSMAARANAAAAAAKEGPPSKNVAEAKAEPDAGASGPAFGLLHATSVSKAEQTARDNAELEASRREREAACERYLLSKAAGGSRDVAIKGLILLAPTGKPLIDGGEAPCTLHPALCTHRYRGRYPTAISPRPYPYPYPLARWYMSSKTPDTTWTPRRSPRCWATTSSDPCCGAG